MILNIIAWIILGGVAGWIASMIMGTDAEQGIGGNIVVGIIGAFIGGMISRMLGGGDFNAFSLSGLLLAILGSVILLFFVKMFSRTPNA